MAQFNTLSSGLGNTKAPTKRIRSRSWFFTFNNPEEYTPAQLIDTFKYIGVINYVFQLEKEETPHYQGLIRFKNPRDISFQECLPNTIHWERCRNWKNAKKYCCKLTTRIDGPWTNIKGLKWRRTIKDPLDGKQLYDFQETVLRIIKGEPDDRTIHWFWEQDGNTGKSSLCKHIKLKYGKQCITLSGKSNDVMFAIKQRLNEDQEDIDIILYDIPRSNLKYISYNAIEKLKDGYFFNGKYEGDEILMNPPHIICFANEPPKKSKMSLDRWNIINIKD